MTGGWRQGLVALAAVALLSGCVDLPDSGPIVDVDVSGERNADRVSSIDPRPPQPGASRLEIVNGFLEAMMAWPISTSVAKQYLTDDAAEEWNRRSTVIYSALGTPREDGSSISIRMRDAALLDESGGWRGALPDRRSTLRFQLTIEDGEFRIIDPINALVVRADWFQERYRQASLYFFDPTAQVLVPEPAFVPVGETFATNLVTALLAGPPARLRDVVQTFVPPRLSVGLSVPIDDGVATLDLQGEAPTTSPQSARLILAQLAATLRQEPGISSIRVTIGGEEVDPPGAATEYDVESADDFDPAATGAAGVLYGLRDGRIVAGTVDDLRPVHGPLGRRPHRFDSMAVAPVGDRVAAVATDGRRVTVAPLRSLDGTAPQTTVADGTAFVRPAWDASGRLWLLDRTQGGARLLVSEDGARAREVDVPGVSGADARRLLVSRDGTRLVALVSRPGGDALVAARIVLDRLGRVRKVVDSSVIRSLTGRTAIDVAWTAPAEIAVLSPARAGELFEVETVAVDGATVGVDTLSTMVPGRVIGLAGEPYAETPVYAITPDALVDIRTGEQLTTEDRVRELDYSG